MKNVEKNCGFSFREFTWILLLIGSIALNVYLGTKEDGPKTFDEDNYKKKISSYEKTIGTINKQNDSLNRDNKNRLEKISLLKDELKELNKKSKYYEELYKKAIRDLDSMSDNDITALFTKEFK